MEHDLVRLQHIVAVAQERHFGRAAAYLRISQPALSRSIRMFEDRYGLRIFDRGRGGVTPTAAGAQVIREADKILRDLRDLRHHVRLFGEQGSGLIRIVFAPMLSHLVMPRLARLALSGGRHALLEAIAPSHDQLPGMLLDERNEMAFCATRTAIGRPGLVVEPVGALTTCALVRSDHPLVRAGAGPVPIEALADYPKLCIADLSDSRTDSRVGGVVCSDIAVLKQATLDSDGVWIACRGLAEQELQLGALRELHIEAFTFERPEICVAWRQGRTLSKLARAMIEEVRQTLAGL